MKKDTPVPSGTGQETAAPVILHPFCPPEASSTEGAGLSSMSIYHAGLAEVAQRDGRYAYEAYEFVFAALTHTQKVLGRVPAEEESGELEPRHHVRGPELL